MPRPVLLFCFSNDRDNYLPGLQHEQKNIRRSLRIHDDKGLVKVVIINATTINDIYTEINHYKDDLIWFHFSGHAQNAQLQLETDHGASQHAHARGLAELLGTIPNLRFVFLNGCATRELVDDLFAENIPAVLATRAKIRDTMAVEFSEQFYITLGSLRSIQTAYKSAVSYIHSVYPAFDPFDKIGNILPAGSKAFVPWNLYFKSDATKKEILRWDLESEILPRMTVSSRYAYRQRGIEVNDILVEGIVDAIASFNEKVREELQQDFNMDIPTIKREIVDFFPTPVGEQLRKLFARSDDPEDPDPMEVLSEARLNQLLETYRSLVQFVCFIMLSQLWDAKFENPDLTIREEFTVDFKSFLSLNAEQYPLFNYVKLIQTIAEVFEQNQIAFFIEELKSVRTEINDSVELYGAYKFMNRLHERLRYEPAGADEIEGLCMEAEEQLGILLRSLAFLGKYKLHTIKNIELIKSRHKKPRYRHMQILQMKAMTVAGAGLSEVGLTFRNFADCKSVVFLKTEKDQIIDYLNISPFIIDENALAQEYSSKLYTYSYREKGTCYYHWVNNRTKDPFPIDGRNYPEVQDEMQRFEADVFGIEHAPGPVTTRLGRIRQNQ